MAAEKVALVLGAAGQAGSYLVEILVDKGYEVWAAHHGTPFPYQLTTGKEQMVKNVRFDVDNGDFHKLLRMTRPDEIYNMAALMFAPASWSAPEQYIKVNGLAPVRLLDAVAVDMPGAKVFQAGSADVFERGHGDMNEESPRKATTPYGMAKIMAEDAVRIYRDHSSVYCCTGTFFNMESPRRKKSFFAEKVAHEVALVRTGAQHNIKLGTLSAVRDWGLAYDYVTAAWMMLQQYSPADYVIGTGFSHTCLEFVEYACQCAGVDFNVVEFDDIASPEDRMCADPKLIKKRLGWSATYIFQDVVELLVDHELKAQGVGLGESSAAGQS